MRWLLAIAFFCVGVLTTYVLTDPGFHESFRVQGSDRSSVPTRAMPVGPTAASHRDDPSSQSVAPAALSTNNDPRPTLPRLPSSGATESNSPGGAGALPRRADSSPREQVPGEPPDTASAYADNTGPIPLAEGLELEGDLALLHERLENEDRDANWASVMEIQLLTYFASRPALAENFALPVVVCRQSGCEVQSIGYGPDSFQNWQAATADIGEQPWAQEFVDIRATAQVLNPGVQGIVTILTRITKDATVQAIETAEATS